MCNNVCLCLLLFAYLRMCYANDVLPWKCWNIFSEIYYCGFMFQTIWVTEPTWPWTDWFDGLHTFMRYICHKSWLGGWFLPQKKSYFALQLPKGWWIFGLDLSLHGDVDLYQFKFFADLCRKKVHFSTLACSPYKMVAGIWFLCPYFWFHVVQHALINWFKSSTMYVV